MQRLLLWTVGRFIRWLGPATILSLLLLTTVLGSVAWALAEVVRGPGLGLLLAMAFGGLLLGWLLAAARPVPAWLAAGLIAVVAVEAVLWQVGELSGPVWLLSRALAGFLRQSWRWPLAGPPAPALAALNLAAAEVGLALSQLVSRLYLWLAALLLGESHFDLPAITAAWALAVAGAAAWAGWGMRRLQQPLLAVLPAGTLLGTTLAYTLRPIGAFLPLMAATILLVGLAAQRGREQRWQAARFDYATDIRVEVGFAVGATALVLVVIASITPNLTITGIARRVQEFFDVRAMNESLGLRPGQRAGALPETLRAPGLPQQHLLGSGPELSERVVMLIKTSEPPPETGTTEPTQIIPHYWRSLTYDIYTGYGWTTSDAKPLTYEAGEAAHSAAGPGRRLVQQEVERIDPASGLLYAAGELVQADPAYTVHWRSEDDALAATSAASTYRAGSLIPAVSAAELRAAGVDYPGWIRSRYLALPPELPARVQTLAHQLTAPAASPFDQAKAIEAYLRSFPYSLEVTEPPPGRDVVDYFLFDLQQGYCDYYATAMVVLARAAGLPARLAVGYIGGRYQADSDRYLVSEAEAHSWPEIYFPEYGWINFEPTGGRPALERPVETPPLAPPLLGEGGKEASRPVGMIWPALLAGVGLALLAGLGGRAWDNWRLRRAAPAATIATLYRRLYRHGPRLAVSPQPADTPYEFAAALSRRLTELAAASRWPEFLAAGAAEIDLLAGLYVHACFSAHPPERASQARAIHTWQRLRRRLWLAWLYRLAGADRHPR